MISVGTVCRFRSADEGLSLQQDDKLKHLYVGEEGAVELLDIFGTIAVPGVRKVDEENQEGLGSDSSDGPEDSSVE